jgi:hypothetical protein
MLNYDQYDIIADKKEKTEDEMGKRDLLNH